MILISGKPRTGIISRCETTKAWQPLTPWRAEDRNHQQTWNTARQACQPLTNWRAEDRNHQQTWSTARHFSHLQTGEQRTGIVSRLKSRKACSHLLTEEQRKHHQQAWEKGIAATHILESSGQALSAGLKLSMAWQPLTPWSAEAGIISMLEIQQGMAATHRLESREQHYQQAWNTAQHFSHSQTGEQGTGIISRHKTQQGMEVTYTLESREQASSAGLKHSKVWQPLTP